MTSILRSRPRAVALCSLVTIMTLSEPIRAQSTGSAAESPPPAVKLVRPIPAGAPIERRFQGRVVAKDTLALAFEIGGELVDLSLVEGSRIARGTPVAALDPAPFERAVRRAELDLAQRERTLARASQLAAGNATSRAAAEDAATARDLADVALAEAREALADATLLAPFDALVAARLVAPHTVVVPGLPIARLQDVSETRVEIDVPERLVNALPSLEAVRFEAEVGPLELVGLETETGPVGQSYTVTLRLPVPADGRAPLPGSSMTVSASLSPASDGGLVLPASALLVDDDGGTAVMVFAPGAGAGGTVMRVPVTVRSRDGASFAVDGIGEGAEVVAAGAHRLRDGERVRRWSGLVVAEDRP